MRTYLDCIPCFFKHGLNSVKIAGATQKQQRQFLDTLGEMVKTFPLSSPPPELARRVNQLISAITGNPDPYKEIKQNSIVQVLALYNKLHKKVARAEDPLLEAVELAIAGNVIDYGVHDACRIEKELGSILQKEKRNVASKSERLFAYKKLKKRLQQAKTILYLGDNAGETVFDRLLIETIHSSVRGEKDILYVVKEHPAINDALITDAYESGLGDVAQIISSGSDAPGTVLSRCTTAFKREFRNADMIISKGQGNFEALSQVKRELFFLLMVKCPVIAADVSSRGESCCVGDTVLLRHPK